VRDTLERARVLAREHGTARLEHDVLLTLQRRCGRDEQIDARVAELEDAFPDLTPSHRYDDTRRIA